MSANPKAHRHAVAAPRTAVVRYGAWLNTALDEFRKDSAMRGPLPLLDGEAEVGGSGGLDSGHEQVEVWVERFGRVGEPVEGYSPKRLIHSVMGFG